jgi:hypothetical protein
VLELGKSGSHGTERGTLPVLADGAVVATLHASNWKEAASAVVGQRSWAFAKRHGELTGRWAADPADAVRLRARKRSWRNSTWAADLEGTRVEVRSTSLWRAAHRFLVDGTVVAEGGSVGVLSPRPTLTADPAMPLDHQVFLLWLELVIIRRNSESAAGGAGAASS